MRTRDDGHNIAITVLVLIIVLGIMAGLARDKAERDTEVYYTVERHSEAPEIEAEACTIYNDPEIPDEIETAAQICALYQGVDPELLEAMAWQESTYNPAAKSGSCMGCMQVHAKIHADRLTAMGVTKEDLLQPFIGMAVGASLIGDHIRETGDLERALQRYNGSDYKERYAKSVLNKRSELLQKHYNAKEVTR